MVRAVVHVAAAALALGLVLCAPRLALAEPSDENASTADAVTDSSGDLAGVEAQLKDLYDAQDLTRTEVVNHLITLETMNAPTQTNQVEERTQEESKQLEKLDSVDKNLEKLVEIATEDENKVEEIEQQTLITATKAATTFTAYTNVSPTGQWASYACGLLPHVGFNQNYFLVQDTSSSYVFGYGDLSETEPRVIGGSCKWWRWYYNGNGVGYLEQRGEGDVVVNAGSHVVLSSLHGYPLLDGSMDPLRKEVGFYALTAVCIYVLHSVLGFTLRLRGVSE